MLNLRRVPRCPHVMHSTAEFLCAGD